MLSVFRDISHILFFFLQLLQSFFGVESLLYFDSEQKFYGATLWSKAWCIDTTLWFKSKVLQSDTIILSRGMRLHCIVVNVLDIIINKFLLQLYYNIHFWANTLGKSVNPLIPQLYGLKSITAVLLQVKYLKSVTYLVKNSDQYHIEKSWQKLAPSNKGSIYQKLFNCSSKKLEPHWWRIWL